MIGPFRLTAVLAAAASLLAQAPPTEPAPKRDRIGERSQEMRDNIETGRPVKSHVRVAVRLKNGNRLRGVVKDGRLVERVDGLRFVEAQAQDAGAGIRLWYSGGGRDYVFVPFRDLSDYTVMERLSQQQLEAFEQEMQMAEERRTAQQRAEAQRILDANQTPPGAGEAPPVGEVPAAPGQEPAATVQTPAAAPTATTTLKKGTRKTKAELAAEAAEQQQAAAATQAKEQQQEYFALLQEYPPTAGWNQAKRDEIARRKVVVGAVPSAQEQRFVDKFAQWQKACEFFAVKAPAENADGAQEPSSGGGTKKGRRK